MEAYEPEEQGIVQKEKPSPPIVHHELLQLCASFGFMKDSDEDEELVSFF
jgi:hypothetical protein